MQVSLELRLRDAEALNVTLWGLGNHSSLHLHPPGGAEERRREAEEAGGQTGAFYCCYPGATPKGLCLLRLFNQTALRGTENNQPLLPEEGGGQKRGGKITIIRFNLRQISLQLVGSQQNHSGPLFPP